MEIVLATHNKKKVEEIRRMFKGAEITFLDMNDFPDGPKVEEDGETFSENADAKAVAIAMYTKKNALADDSGLAVDALDGAPGVRSARFAGPGATDEQNLQQLLASLKKKVGASRNAHFECVLALANPLGQVVRFSGTVNGTIVDTPRGANGFGYDPVFVPHGEQLTFAEMAPWQKDRLSHRGRALENLVHALTQKGSDIFSTRK